MWSELFIAIKLCRPFVVVEPYNVHPFHAKCCRGENLMWWDIFIGFSKLCFTKVDPYFHKSRSTFLRKVDHTQNSMFPSPVAVEKVKVTSRNFYCSASFFKFRFLLQNVSWGFQSSLQEDDPHQPWGALPHLWHLLSSVASWWTGNPDHLHWGRIVEG